MNISEFDFQLPEALIAQTPLKNRDDSRMLVAYKEQQKIIDDQFSHIGYYLKSGDVLVLNNTRVLPARLFGVKSETGAKLEVLLLNQLDGDQWEVLIKPAKRAKVGTKIDFGEGLLLATVVAEKEHGGRIVEFSYEGIFLEILEQLGEMPLPPYIKEQLEDADRYQTVYAKENGSAAAPTAGLHFTKQRLQQLQEKGVEIHFITLHVGLGTFRPVSVDNISEHEMHSEFYVISKQTAEAINCAKQEGRRVFAVGTTSIRTLETVGQKFKGVLKEDQGWTDIFIKPGYQFQIVDGFLTNFHLPKSTLVMLVSAFLGTDFTLNAYHHAIKERYRFFSFGDAMLVLN